MEHLVWSIKNGELEQVQNFFDQNKFNVNTEIKGRFPLHYAADYGQLEVLRYLIENGADTNLKDKHGITPLLAAIWEGHTKCVEMLLKEGASKHGKTPEGRSYFEVAEKDEIKNMLT